MPLPEELRDAGLLPADRAAFLSDIETGRLFSVSAELRSVLYLGALFVVYAVGATVNKYKALLGPMAVNLPLLAGLAATFAYIHLHRVPFSKGWVDSPDRAFDYVLFLGCALVGIECAYLEGQYRLLKDHWDWYLAGSSVLFFYLAYRHDNRMVLSMALANAAAWMGVRWNRWGFDDQEVLLSVFGLASAGAGTALQSAGWKPHFQDTYLHFGVHALLLGLLIGCFSSGMLEPFYLTALLGACAFVIVRAYRARRFVYFLYGVLYAYAGAAFKLTEHFRASEALLTHAVGAASLAAVIFVFRGKLKQEGA
jgi:hypothetical protein